MLQTKLILVEGLPGSGKSTTAQYLAMQVRKNGLQGRWFYEEEVPHPIWTAGGDQPAAHMTPEYFMAVQLSHWTAFVAKAKQSDEVTILESSLFQDPISTLLRRDVKPENILHYIRTVEKVIQVLDPVLLYFYQPNGEEALKVVCGRRGKSWEDFHIRRMKDTAFAQHRGLEGFEGLRRFWQEHKALCDRLTEEFDGKMLVLDRATGNWASHYRDISEFLSLEFFVDQMFPATVLKKYVGTYTYREDWGNKRRMEFTVQLEGKVLALYNFAWLWAETRLIPKEKDTFYAEAWPFEFTFEEDTDGVVRCLRAGEQRVAWGGIEQVFPKVS
jgi:hypothetical protein